MTEASRGTGVSPGVGAGPVRTLTGVVPVPPAGDRHDGDGQAARGAATDALAAVAADLEAKAERAGDAGNEDGREVLRAQALIARDPGLAGVIDTKVADGASAARAVYEAFGVYREVLGGAGDRISARVADLDDIRDRTVAHLLGLPMPGVPDGDDVFVLVASDLSPADTALLDPARVVAFVTEHGGPISHTAILARAMGVPAVVACVGCRALADGTTVLVDGATGEVREEPPEEDVARAERSMAARAAAVDAATGPGMTKDGHPVPLLANIGGPKDIEAALAHGAEGVGLYRTEFLFLDRTTPPSEEEQVTAYRTVFEAFPRGRVIVRTLDAGADKPLAFLSPPAEEPNPALGERGLRMLLRHGDVLAGQLRALAAASAGLSTRLQVMAPMVADIEDARAFVAACAEAGIADPGIMVETPSAALRARDLGAEVGFFSIGTNDLAQYLFAADRRLATLARLHDPWQPALLDLVAFTAEAAYEAGTDCEVCGEAAADPALCCVLVGLGVTALSMSASALPAVRAALAACTLDDCHHAASAARAAGTATDARAAARAVLGDLTALGL